ncbi:MAG: Lrp/AsnC family transcriptional regulator [Candidatus Woesearchaeota archaeon]
MPENTMKTPKIDLKDRRILAALDMDARMPITILAKKVGLSRQVVEYRLNRLKKENVIFGAKGVFDSVVVGQKWYRVLFRLADITQEKKDELVNFLHNQHKLFWLGETGGNWDLIMNFICKDHYEFNKIFETIISDFGNTIMDYEILIYIDVHDQSRAYILGENNNLQQVRQEFYHQMKELSNYKLDELDKNIIHELGNDALISNLEIAQKYNVSANTIKNRIDEMRKSNLLLGYRMFINPRVFGMQNHILFFEITKLNLEREKEFYNYLATIPYITFIVKHIGKWRIGMEVETKTVEDFQNIFVAIRSKFKDIINGFESFPLFKDETINYFPRGCLG